MDTLNPKYTNPRYSATYLSHNKMIITGGWLLVVFSILFVGITLLIDNLAQSQTMLYDLEHHNLFKVVAGTTTIRTLLTIYSLTPLLLIPGAVATFYAFSVPYEANMRVGMYFATAGALALSLSLLILPSINWHLTTHIASMGTGATQTSMIILLQAMHSYFGVFVGDLLGFGSLLVWFYITSIVMMKTPVVPHSLGVIQLIVAIVATLILAIRYADIVPNMQINIQAPGVIALWTFLTGIGLISLRRDRVVTDYTARDAVTRESVHRDRVHRDSF